MSQKFFEKYSELLQRFYHSFHIPVSLYLLDEQLLSYAAVAISPDPAALYLKNAFAADNAGSEKSFYTNHHGIYCGMVSIHETNYRILVGPVSSIPPTPKQCSDILSDIDLPFSRKRDLLYALKKTPLFDSGRFLSLLKFLDFIVNGSTEAPVDADEQNDFEPFEKHDNDLYNVQHNSFEIETKILYVIENGRTTDLLDLLRQVPSSNAALGAIAPDSARILKNTFISSAALVSRTAIRAGLDYEFALTLSDSYISKVEGLKNELEILPLLGRMMQDFCIHVAELNKPKDCSPLTVAILDDVGRHLYETLTVADISTRLHKSPSYISRTFEKDMCLPLKQYILRQKIKEAQWLLISKDHSISDISMQLGFSSQPHFQTAFKKIAGISPNTYRQRYSTVEADELLYSRMDCP